MVKAPPKLRKSKYGTYFPSGAPAHRTMDKMWVVGASSKKEVSAARAAAKTEIQKAIENTPGCAERLVQLRELEKQARAEKIKGGIAKEVAKRATQRAEIRANKKTQL